MCWPALAAIPAVVGAASSVAATAAAAAPVVAGVGAAATAAGGTFLGVSAATWGGIAAASTLAGAGISAIGQVQQSKQQSQAYKENAKLDTERKIDAQRRGSIAEGEQRTAYQRFLGTQRAAMGGSGVVVDEGSSGDILEQTVEYGERDAQRLRVNAEREAWGYAAQADSNRFRAGQAETAGYYKASETFLGGTMNAFRSTPWWQRAWQPATQNP